MRVCACISFAAIAASTFAQVASQPVADTKSDLVPARPRDREVLQALLTFLQADASFPNAIERKGPIMLHMRSPVGVRLIVDPFVLRADVKGKALPKDALDELIKRNKKGQSDEAVPFGYEQAWFVEPIVVGDVLKGSDRRVHLDKFLENYPEARCWVEAWVPGFSKDGNTALVRARIGPTAKSATVTAIVKKGTGGWAVAWHIYAIYQ